MRRTSLTMEPQNPLFITFAMSTPRWDQGSSWKTKLVLRLYLNLLHHLPSYGLFEVPNFNVFFWQRWLFSDFSDKGGSFLIFLIKVALFWGNNDWLCDERDLMKIVGQVFQSLQTLQWWKTKNQWLYLILIRCQTLWWTTKCPGMDGIISTSFMQSTSTNIRMTTY